MSDLLNDPKTIQYLVHKVVQVQGLIGIVAPPGAGKTFLGVDLALHMALGLPWHGRPATGNVLYISAEGAAGFSLRTRAWCDANDVDPERFDGRFYAIRRPIAATIAEELEEVHDGIERLGFRPDAVFFDTMSACGGSTFDENNTKDMKAYNDGTRAIRDNWGCAVVTLHHPSKNGAGPRGSGDFEGALDVLLSIDRQGDTRTLKMTKSRDSEPMEPFQFTLRKHGESAIVTPASGVGINYDTGEMLPSTRSTLAALVERGMGIPISNQEWFYATKLQKTAFYAAKKSLLAGGYVGQDGKRFVPTNKADQLLRLDEKSSRTFSRTPPSSSSAPPYKGGRANELKTEVRGVRAESVANQRADGPGLQEYRWDLLEAGQ
ncbi:AAA family ATPase [Gemmatimonas sp.]